MKPPRISFYVRTQVEDQQLYRYQQLTVPGPIGGGMVTDQPPAVGDLIHLSGNDGVAGGTFVVLDRFWIHSSWGSHNWPYNEPEPIVGPLLDIIVERSDGPFRNEAPPEDDE